MKLAKILLLWILAITLGVSIVSNFSCKGNLAFAQDKNKEKIDNRYEEYNGNHSRFALVSRKVLPTVVSISVKRSVEYGFTSPFDSFFKNDPFFGGMLRPPRQKTRKYVQKSGGSGFIYSKEGYIMTNNHVVEHADEILVKLNDGREVEAELVGNDPETDLAVIRIDTDIDDSMIAELGDSDDLWVGDWVIAIGSPYSLDKTVTVGIASAKGRSGLGIQGGPVFQNFIQTDVAINPGNSGGPLLNINGQVIGINAAVNARAQGIGFAIPINFAKGIEDQLKGGRTIERGYLGIGLEPLSSDEKEPFGVNKKQVAIRILNVEEKSPADKAGLLADDIIVGFQGNKLVSYENFRMKIAGTKPGKKIKLKILRNGEYKTFKIQLGNRANYLGDNKNSTKKEGNQDFFGVVVENLSDKIMRKYNIEEQQGVLVTKVKENSRLEGKVYRGDIITKIIYSGKHYQVDNIKDLEDVKNIISKEVSFVIKLKRGTQNEFVVIK